MERTIDSHLNDLAYLEGNTDELSSSEEHDSSADEKEYAEELWKDRKYNVDLIEPPIPWPHESDDSLGSIDYHDKENDADEDAGKDSNISALKRKRDWICDDSSDEECT